MKIRSIRKIAESKNPSGLSRIMLENEPIADSPLVGGVLDSSQHLSMQLLSGFGAAGCEAA
jgi:hypothetical protein